MLRRHRPSHRPIAGRLVIATHNPGKLRRDARAAGALRHRGGLGRRARPWRARGNRHELSRECPHQGRRGGAGAGLPAFADDSGLVVDALGGAPGIHSARWAGADKNFARAMGEIERQLQRPRRDGAARAARPISSRRCASPGPTATARSSKAGSTACWCGRRAASKGFGYDPMFLPDGYDRTFGEMTERGEARPAAARPRPVAPRARLPQACGGLPWQR